MIYKYVLHIKSGITKITPEILTVFIQLQGYSPATQNNAEETILEFHELKVAQRVEVKLRAMFTCFLTQKLEVFIEERLVNLTSFKESGKYYDNFNVTVPADTQDFDLADVILKSNTKLPDYFMYYGHYANNVPFIIPAHRKPNMKSYEKI